MNADYSVIKRKFPILILVLVGIPLILFLANILSFWEILLGFLAIIVIVIPPHLIISRWFEEYKLSDDNEEQVNQKSKILYSLLMFLFGCLYLLVLILVQVYQS